MSLPQFPLVLLLLCVLLVGAVDARTSRVFARLVDDLKHELYHDKAVNEEIDALQQEIDMEEPQYYHDDLIDNEMSLIESDAASHVIESPALAAFRVYEQQHSKLGATSLLQQKANVQHKARARGAPDGQEGEWHQAPSWWKPPPPESVVPWKEDFHAYITKPTDYNSNMNPNPYTHFYGGTSFVGVGGLTRVLNNPGVFSRTMGGVGGVATGLHMRHAVLAQAAHAQLSPLPPLQELDATMQPVNNYPNAPFYEYDYHKDYIWG